MDQDESAASLRLESTSLTLMGSNTDNDSNGKSQSNGKWITKQPTYFDDNTYRQTNKFFNADDSILENDMDTSNMTPEEVDLRAKRIEMSFDYLDAASLVFSMFSFLLDYMTDIAVAIFHYLNQDYWYSGLTATFVLVPNLITSCMSFLWYVSDSHQESSNPVGRFQWWLRVIFHIFQVGPILRYYESLQYGLTFKEETDPEERKKAYMRMIYEDADASMLRLFESFMESAPQLMLQMYIITKNYPFDDYEYWTLSYSKSLRISLPNKIPMTYSSIAVMFSWELLSVTARMIALALYTSVFVRTVGLVILFHYAVMTGWILSMRTKFCDTKYEELGFNAALGVIFVFCYFNPIDSSTRYRYAAFYTFMFCENSMLMLSWAYFAPYKFWVKEIALTLHYATFFGGLLMMLVYYRWFHPTGGIRIDRSKA